jgi:murein DD-endopeptidase MepM/ murein hydrolase activator NlpD
MLIIRLSLIVLIAGISSIEDSFPYPWEKQFERSTPWNRLTDRKVRRETFFKDLGNETTTYASFVPKSSIQTKGDGEMSELPWARYQKDFPKDRMNRELMWPVRQGKISSGYGLRKGRFHEGLDLIGSYKAPIYAAASGRVVFSGTMNGYGRTVVIYHGNGVSSVYAHNSSNIVRKGMRVKKGDAIARIGSSGKSSGPHLHFEVRKNGKPINPLNYDYRGSSLR